MYSTCLFCHAALGEKAGELGELYARWEEAERTAKIADGKLTDLSS